MVNSKKKKSPQKNSKNFVGVFLSKFQEKFTIKNCKFNFKYFFLKYGEY